MIKSIRFQFTLWYIGSISLLILLFGGSVLFSFKTILVRNIDQILYNSGEILEEKLSEYTLKDKDDPRSLYEPFDKDHDMLIDKIDEEANEIFSVNRMYAQLREFPQDNETVPQVFIKTATLDDVPLPFSQKTYKRLQAESSVVETVTGVFDFPLRMLSIQVHDMDGRPYILQLALSLQETDAILQELFLIVVILFPPLLVVLAFVGYGFMKRVFSPVKKMVAVTKSITADDLSLRLELIESHDEIGELAATLNDMIARLERSFQQIRQFSADVSHELKTPLTELICNVEVALRRERPMKEYQEVLMNVIEDARHLQHMVEDMLLLAQMDSLSLPLFFKPIALNEVFLQVFEQAYSLLQKKQLALDFDEIAPVTITGDIGLLSRLLTNLLANAIQYTPSGGKITVALRNEPEQAIFTITNTDVGIPEDALAHIFDRFYRVEQSRSHDTGGSGLGLAIAQKIANLHGGTIEVESVIGTETTFQVLLPKNNNSEGIRHIDLGF